MTTVLPGIDLGPTPRIAGGVGHVAVSHVRIDYVVNAAFIAIYNPQRDVIGHCRPWPGPVSDITR